VQVGDLNVIRQKELNQFYNGSDNGLDSSSPMLYHVMALCENCLKQIDSNLFYNPKEDVQYKILMQEYNDVKSQFDQQVHQCIETFLNEIKVSTIEQYIKKSLEGIAFSKDNRPKKKSQIIEERKQVVKNSVLANFERSDDAAAVIIHLTELARQFSERAYQYFDAFDGDATVLEIIDCLKERTLNPIISYPYSRVQPILADEPCLIFYRNAGYTVKDLDIEIKNHLESRVKRLRKNMRSEVAKRISNLDSLLAAKLIDNNVFLTENKVYECLKVGNYDVEIIQCNECGIAYRRIDKGDFRRVSQGVLERVNTPFAKYVNCLCGTCFEKANHRQMSQEFKDIESIKVSISEEIIPNYRTVVGEQYRAYVEMFSDVDLDQLKSDKYSKLESAADIREFLMKNKNRILKNADGFVRSNIRLQHTELNQALDRLASQYENFKDGCLGYYKFFEPEAKLIPISTDQDRFYPFKAFYYKDDFSNSSITNVSRFHEKCFDGVMEKVVRSIFG
jgi:hypothetical protein